ncbi:hypothetical protein TIFTF001_033815 [Ficus carica]|uniref:Uncharacterized protein n=1 Tax=Ficus carica TaxID=3494 RepID=A0AA88DZA8_FICCA|nr:hypothetical protein TIFTF001_033815 [Ficus carica]
MLKINLNTTYNCTRWSNWCVNNAIGHSRKCGFNCGGRGLGAMCLGISSKVTKHSKSGVSEKPIIPSLHPRSGEDIQEVPDPVFPRVGAGPQNWALQAHDGSSQLGLILDLDPDALPDEEFLNSLGDSPPPTKKSHKPQPEPGWFVISPTAEQLLRKSKQVAGVEQLTDAKQHRDITERVAARPGRETSTSDRSIARH